MRPIGYSYVNEETKKKKGKKNSLTCGQALDKLNVEFLSIEPIVLFPMP